MLQRQPLPRDEVVHYKGGRYVVEAIARASWSPETMLVVYRSLDDGRCWVRPLSEKLMPAVYEPPWMAYAVDNTGVPVERYRKVGVIGAPR